jgi:hypothetical protein
MTEEQTGASRPITGPTANNDQAESDSPKVNLGDLEDKVEVDTRTATDAVKETASTAMDKVTATVAEQTNFAARRVNGIATALHKVGTELENGDQAQLGRYAKRIGESVQAIANNIEGRDIGEIAGIAEDLGRKQPLAFLGAAALAGLAASRFLTASSKRTSASAARASEADKPNSPQASGVAAGAGGSNNG